ncbi:hypothetical protein WN59_07505 [Salinicoccus sediminis]|uniref:Bile acid:sodium symporter n=1 Tax=Salinicoccus sediminis TaxID=1432562 RepID=A0A0M2SNX8_9STAP|nr:hypothetical protein WN59_07505 [Salinicoccus sediminis]
MLERLNGFIQKWIAVITPMSLAVGVMLGDFGAQFLFLITFLFAFMTFTGALGMDFKDFKTVLHHPAAIVITLVFLHILMPVWAWLLASAIFDDPLYTIGFTLAVAVPTGVTSVIWVSVTRGNLPITLSIILIDTLLAPIILPLVLSIISGEAVAVDNRELIMGLIWMIVLPTLLGVILNHLTGGRVRETLGRPLAPFSKMSLMLIIMINGSVISPYFYDFSGEIIGVLLLVLFITISGYAFALPVGHYLLKDPGVITAFTFNAGMRNISVGVVIATAYFPAKVAMPVVFCMLFQQVMASLFSKVIERYQARVGY